MRGKKMSNESRERVKQARLGKPMYENTRKKFIEAARKRRGELNPMFGRRGINSPRASLNQSQVDEIRQLLPSTKIKKIAEKFGVSRMTISRIRDNVTY